MNSRVKDALEKAGFEFKDGKPIKPSRFMQEQIAVESEMARRRLIEEMMQDRILPLVDFADPVAKKAGQLALASIAVAMSIWAKARLEAGEQVLKDLEAGLFHCESEAEKHDRITRTEGYLLAYKNHTVELSALLANLDIELADEAIAIALGPQTDEPSNEGDSTSGNN